MKKLFNGDFLLIYALPVLIISLVVATGCGTFGKNPSPPTATERGLYDLHTNFVTVVVPQTNTVTLTNFATVQQTNITGVVEVQQITNVTAVTQITQVTNLMPSVTLTTSPATTAAVQAVGTAINTAAPGIGSIVSMGILALLGGWGYLRGSKQQSTATALGQEIETIRAFIKTLPNGPQLDTGITTFLQQHQLESGVIQQVMDMLQSKVSNPDAQAAAKEISTFVAQLK